MKKGQYNYYNSKLVTSTAEKLRGQYLKEIATELKEGNYELVELAFVLVPEDKGRTHIKHVFRYKGEVKTFYEKNFYDLYAMVVAVLK